MTKAEIMQHVLNEVEEYRRIAVANDDRYGADSIEAMVALGKYRALLFLARDLGAEEYLRHHKAGRA